MSSRPTFFISTAIPYANGAPHIGHAYERIATDAIYRFKKLDGYDAFFCTGMDEHGQKVQQTSAKECKTPRAFVDEIAAKFDEMGALMNAVATDVVRTTQPRHYESVQEIWRRMEAKGDIYLSKYDGWYSVRDEAYFDESELTEKDGKRYAPSGAPVEWVEEESFFFKLSAYQDKLLALYESQPDFVYPEKYRNEIVAFVKRGLTDLSVSRTTFNWGVPVPGHPKHVMYVWVDALTNYITACGYPDTAGERWRYWPADAHVIGKDISRFHAIYWPAFLMSAELPLPKQVVVHGFLFNRGEKMSKSVGNVISPQTLADHYGVDQLRYFFLREVPFGQDGNYSHEAIVQRMNADLANDLGNLAQRSLSMIAKNCEGRAPKRGAATEADQAILDQAYALLDSARASMKDFALHQYLADVWKVVADANRYFAGEEPWKKGKTDPERMQAILSVTIEVLRVVAILAQPVMPTAMGKMLDILGVPADRRDFAHLSPDFRVAEGAPLPPPAPIFPRYVDPEEAAAAQKPAKSAKGKDGAGKEGKPA